MEGFWLAALIAAAVGPMLYESFRRDAGPTRPGYRSFTFVWALAVLYSSPLVLSSELSRELLVLAVAVVLCILICAVRLLMVFARQRK